MVCVNCLHLLQVKMFHKYITVLYGSHKKRSPEYFVSILTYYHCILLFIYISVNFSSKYILGAVRIPYFLFAPAKYAYGYHLKIHPNIVKILTDYKLWFKKCSIKTLEPRRLLMWQNKNSNCLRSAQL